MDLFVLKLIAMLTMLADHVAVVFLSDYLPVRIIGRVAFILYAFMMAESYRHLKDKPERIKAHLIKLAVLFLLSEIPYDLMRSSKWFDPDRQNVILTLALGFSALAASGYLGKKLKNKGPAFPAGCILIWTAACLASYFLKSEYSFTGVLLIGGSYAFASVRDGMKPAARFCAATGVLALYLAFYIWSMSGFGSPDRFVVYSKLYSPYTLGTLAAVIPMALYSGKKGYDSPAFRAVYSFFYPAQFCVLLLLKLAVSP